MPNMRHLMNTLKGDVVDLILKAFPPKMCELSKHMSNVRYSLAPNPLNKDPSMYTIPLKHRHSTSLSQIILGTVV